MTDIASKAILAIDTSSSFLRLAVRFGDDRLIKSSEEVDRSHGQMIMRKIAALMESAGATPESLSGIVVCTGPGSFTGLRVGIAVAKGMAVALEIPVVGVSLFDVAATRMADSHSPIVALVLQRKGEYHAAKITNGHFDFAEVSTLTIAQIAASTSKESYVVIGPVEASLTQQVGAALQTIEYDASDLLQIGESRLITGGDNIDSLEPLYFGKSQAEIKFDQRHKKT